MKEYSQEVIEIDGKEYTLFLNRKGIVAWEKFSKEENKELAQAYDKIQNIINGENAEITDETNPFDGLEDFPNKDELALKSYKKLFWIMLNTNHHLTYKQAEELFDKAIETYGEEQLIQLGDQMVNDANLDRTKKAGDIKKLPALRQMN